MATKAGYSAGRVYLQVVPSYKNFLNTLRRDAAGPLGKAIADTFEKELDKSGTKVGENFGKNVSRNISKNIDTSGVDKATDAVKKNERATRDAAKSQRDYHRTMQTSADKGTLLSRVMRNLRGDSQDGANAFRFFNFAVLGLSAVGVGLVPVLAAVAGGLALFGPILAGLAGGLGVAILGFSGIGDAVKALGEVEDATSAKSSAFATAIRNAARAVADARRGLKDAYRQSADGIRNALERQEDAERSLADAQRDAKEAQRDLTEARKEAAQEQEDLANQIAQNQLDERQGVIDLFNAYNQYGGVMADGGSTNLEREQADIALKQAQLNLKRIREEQKRLADEKKKNDKAGINGTDKVRRAQERLTEALRRQEDAQRRLARATRDVQRAREDGARAIADAQRRLTRAQEDYNTALAGGTAAADKLAEAMDKLSPAGRRFARFIFSLRDGFRRIRAEAQEGMLPGVEEGMRNIIETYGPGFTRFVREMSKTLGDFFAEAGDRLTQGGFREFFATLSKDSIQYTQNAGAGLLDMLEGIANIFRIASPQARKFSQYIADTMESFNGWTRSDEGRKGIERFFAYVERVGPKVKDFFVSLARALGSIAEALAPLGESVLIGLTAFFDKISKTDPDLLRQLSVGLLAIVFALQASAGITAMVSLLGALAAAPLLVIVAGVAGLAAAFFLLGNSGEENAKIFDTLKKKLDPVFDIFSEIYQMVKEQLVKTFNEALLPALKKIGKAIDKNLIPAIERFWPVIRPIAKFLIRLFGSILRTAISGVADVISGVIRVFSGLLDFISYFFAGEWGKALGALKDIFFGTLEAIWGLVKIIFSVGILGVVKGVFLKTIPGIVKGFWRGLKSAFTVGLKAVAGFVLKWTLIGYFAKAFAGIVSGAKGLKETLKDIFKDIRKAVANPLIDFGELVINDGLIDAVRTLQKWIGISKGNRLPHVPFPDKYATGGIVPGYTPGRDNRFINVGGGEAILRPEATRAIGARSIHALNSAAIRGGVGAVEGLLGFAKGGIVWPTKGKNFTTYRDHDGLDFNGKNNRLGDPYYATAAGTIAYTGIGRGYGRKVELNTADGPTVIYGHSSAINVKAGDRVRKGQMLGKIGYTGNVFPRGPAGSHLHFGLKGEGPDEGRAALKYLAGAVFGKGLFSSGLGDLGKAAISALKDPKAFLTDKVSSAFVGLKGVGGSGLDMLKGIPKKLIGGIAEKIKDLAMKGLGLGAKFFKYTPLGLGISGAKKLAGFIPGIGGKTPLYDNGGYLPPGISTVMNATGRPEPVLTPEQWDKMGHGGGGTTYDLKAYGADPRAVVREFIDDMRFEQRRAVRSGTLSRKVNA